MENPSIEDDMEWEKKEGFPSTSDPFIRKYLQGRDNLIEQEKKQRSDRIFRENLSPTAAEACAIVDQIRFEEQQTLWTRDLAGHSNADGGDIYPGMMFTLAKDRIENSKLFKIVRKMPKGALLHCHLEATVDVDWIFQEAFQTRGMHIQSPEKLSTPEGLLKSPIEFRYLKTSPERTSSLWTDSYERGTFVELHEAADSFPSGGRDGFLKWLKRRTTVTLDESLKHHEGTNEIWRKFISCFPILNSIIYYEPITRKFFRRLFQQLVEDGVQWVDMRSAFYSKFYREGSETPDPDHFRVFEILEEEIEAFKASGEGKQFWGARMIWTSVRAFNKQQIVEAMKECIEMKKEFPELIAGYDFVGQEDLGRPLSDLIPELFWFKKRCAEEGVDIPFFFHAGETLGDGDSTDENLFDAVLLGTRRIGHGFSLFKHPLLIDMIKEKKILVESCPISNEVLRFTSSIMSHPLPALLARGVPASLSNDDPAMLGQGLPGMSHDFWQALQGWDNLGLAGLGSLAENSVRWAAFEDCTQKDWVQSIKDGAMGNTIRAERLKEWIRSWERFCQWIVSEYGADEDFEREEQEAESVE